MNRTSSTLHRVFPSIILSSVLLIVGISHAQISFNLSTPPPGTHGPVKDKPFVANKVMHMKRSLADGTITSSDAQIYEARDSSGRRLVEIHLTFPSGSSRPAKIFVSDTVSDPTNNTALSWNSFTKTATLMHISTPELRALASAAATGKAPPPPVEIKPEVIGQRKIGGLMTTGRRTQHALPAGAIGNDTAIDTEHEWWTDEDLQLVVLDSSRSPQHGEQTTELIDVKRVEPDPARFLLPDGYTIRNIGPASRNASVDLGTSPASTPLDLAHAPALSHDEAELKLKSSDPDQQTLGAAALVKEAQASDSINHKDYIAYQLAGADVGLSDAQQLAESDVHSAETATTIDAAGNVTREDFNREVTLGRYWHTLGYIYFRRGEIELAKQYIESAWNLDPHAYYGAHLGRILEDSGHPAAALAVYREALEAPGSAHEKDHIRENIQSLSGAVDATPATASTLTGVASPADGTALFDLNYSSSSAAPTVRFVSGPDAFKPLAPAIARSEAPTFTLPDNGPEVVIRRVELTCTASAQPACQLHPLSALQAEATLPSLISNP